MRTGTFLKWLSMPEEQEQPKIITVRVALDGKVFEGMLYAIDAES